MLNDFAHLHVHSEYSLLDGAIKFEKLMQKAVADKMTAIALTDHGNLFGAVDFYKTAKKYDIKPIIGCEIYLSSGKIHEKKYIPGKRLNSHLTILVKNEIGYKNLVKLISIAHLEGMYYKPRVDKEILAKHSEGLVCLSGCLASEINHYIVNKEIKKAQNSISELNDIFGRGNFYLEIQDHGMKEQKIYCSELINFSKKLNLPLVASNDVHFLGQDDYNAHDVMICIGTGKKVNDPNRLKYSQEVYLKSPQEMNKIFGEIPSSLSNTLEIAEKCNFDFHLDPLSVDKYPKYNPPKKENTKEYFENKCWLGLKDKYGENPKNEDELKKRLIHEMSIIAKMQFTSYFLIIADFIQWAKKQLIPVGTGRGSAAGSLVAYALGITNICPLQFGLIFERFLNPERLSPPDIDIDFCQSRRGEVISYVRQKYGEKNVAHIVTFGSLGAKSVVRDVARVLDYSYSDGDRIAKMIPTELKITLDKAEKLNPDIQNALKNDEILKNTWQHAKKLEGLNRGVGIHAAGVVIGDRPLDEICPLTRGNEGEVVTQYEMGAVSDLGLLKIDFLGLKTLTVIQDCINLIQSFNQNFKIEEIPLTDKKTFEMLNRGETTGVFQLESGGMVNLCKQFDINSVDDIIALIALYRPGPMDLIPEYVKRKKGKTKISYLHPLLEEVSSETYGILIYQEQVMRAANLLAGYSMGDADELRRAMGKKNPAIMEKERDKFVNGCKKINKIPQKKANDIFDLLEKFAGYGFNKSHSAAYGVISYQTAFLKANYPVEFMSALLSNEINNTDKISHFVAECKKMKINILPPDINNSQEKFSTDNGAIRFGLSAIKNVGHKAMQNVISERKKNGKFTSIDDFASRLDTKSCNKKILESLCKAGAFDFANEDRDIIFYRIENIIATASAIQKDKANGQKSLFATDDLISTTNKNFDSNWNENLTRWNKNEILAYEKELLGFYVTGNPLDEFKNYLNQKSITKLKNIPKLNNSTHNFSGLISKINQKITKKDKKTFAIFQVEDYTDSAEVIAWNDSYSKFKDIIEENNILHITATKDQRSDEKRIILKACKKIDKKDIPKKSEEIKKIINLLSSKKSLNINLNIRQINKNDLKKIHDILIKNNGDHLVKITLTDQSQNINYNFDLNKNFSTHSNQSLLDEIALALDTHK